ncbi:MAG: type II secretion system minor pseudopilin GspH [Gammaproteobacteria bacterium]|nr:type II secretion system minor pseudopilin GspH [Gammaproteobacteria bacterium]MCP4090496.1 type II secretion system minor pseudopilin GspH [Gammaproteobacteria bacterium]MCP4276639.1 type II secretion system minor pseudopilin GspH [Gammaproteobacteria bacterium]MCP4831389.1 type II secretion system minor pseudopilin GspH [Gammaproteobacteria bacterium]MCP4927933.1 type II secretion system minor pseudopilin GspH [Gammaproteobacteria bacterium]
MTLRYHHTLPRLNQAGFSLLEIMVVVVIIGIILSLATLSIGTATDDGVDEHSRRFEGLLELALEEASIQGRELGLRFYQHNYEFSARVAAVDKDNLPIWIWEPLDSDQLLKPRNLGEDITLGLELDGNQVVLEYERDTKEPYTPQIFIFSSGDIFPAFMLRVRPSFNSNGITLTVNEMGEVETSRDEF